MDQEIKSKEHLFKRIEDFLKEQRTENKYYGDGFADLKDGDLDELHEIVNGIIRLKFKPSWEGVLSVQANLIDRSKYKPMHFFPVCFADRREEKDSPGAYLAALKVGLDSAINNVSIASSELDTLNKLIGLEERRQAAEKNKG